MSSADELRKKLDQTWQKMLPLMLQRLEVIRRVHKDLSDGKLSESLRAEGAQEAHKLAGSLGVFGMKDGSNMASEIEQILSSEKELERNAVAQLGDRLDKLRDKIKAR